MRTLKRKAYLWLLQRMGRETEVFAPHGVSIRVPKGADPNIRYGLARGRPYEAAEAAMVAAHLKAGTNVVELGGSMGIVSALVRSRIGPDARHVIVEAVPHLVAICRENAAVGAAPGAVEVVAAAVDYSGAPSVTFSSVGTAHDGRLARGGEMGVSVPTVTLKKLAEDLPEGPFALICDIEGAELQLFEREDRNVLERVSLLIMETHPRLYDGREKTLEWLLQRIGSLGFRKLAEQAGVVCYCRP